MLHALHPDTVVRWHREGFRCYWNRKSRRQRAGRPPIDTEIRKLIRQMQSANIDGGALRIHGELLKLGIEISQATVSKYQPPGSSTMSDSLPGSKVMPQGSGVHPLITEEPYDRFGSECRGTRDA